MNELTIETLKKIPIFSRLNDDELSVMTHHMEFLTVEQGKLLFHEGDQGEYVCFVVSGRLDVIKKTFTGEVFILNTLSRGQSFGEMSIIENTMRSATVKATTPTDIVILNRTDFDSVLKDHPEIGTKILKGISLLLSRKLRQTTSRLIDYMSKET